MGRTCFSLQARFNYGYTPEMFSFFFLLFCSPFLLWNEMPFDKMGTQIVNTEQTVTVQFFLLFLFFFSVYSVIYFPWPSSALPLCDGLSLLFSMLWFQLGIMIMGNVLWGYLFCVTLFFLAKNKTILCTRKSEQRHNLRLEEKLDGE